jgi:hypothetical protein
MPPRLGFVLVRGDVELPWLARRQYRGIDRLPFVPNPLQLEDNHLRNAWNEYLDTWENGRLGQHLSIAEQIRRQLDEVGESTEIIYADIAVAPRRQSFELPDPLSRERERSLAWLITRSAEVEPSPREFVPIGFDISTPIPSFHSVLVQPGLVRQDSDLAVRLNDFGLIAEDTEYAAELMNVANGSGYLLSTFCVIRILASPEGL